MIDLMDLDQIVDVPDTPDRLVNKHGMDGSNGVKTENQRSPFHCHGQKLYPEKGSRDQPMIIDSGSKERSLRPPKCPSSPNSSRHPPTSSYSLMSLSSSRKASLIRKVEKKPCYPTHDSIREHLEPVRTSHASKSSSQDDDFVDLTEGTPPCRPVRGNASSSAVPGNSRADIQKRSILFNGASFSHEPSNMANASRNGKAEMNNASRGGLSIAFADMKKPDLSLDPVAPARVNKQKRLVKNGLISPDNIAKYKQPVGKAKEFSRKDINGSVAVAHNHGSMASNAPPPISIRELVAEDNDSHTRKGKGVISHTYSSSTIGPEWETKNLRSRSMKKAAETTYDNICAGKGREESSKWRSTRNPTREINNISSSDKEHHPLREGGTPKFSMQHQEKRLDRRGKGITVADGEGPSLISSEHFCAQSLKESASHPRSRSLRLNEPHSAADTLIKRQKQGLDIRRYAECSTPVSDDLEVLLSSPAEAANLRTTSSYLNNTLHIESSPQLRHDTRDEDVKARQLEADELLARELQEQFYNETPAFGFDEINLQHPGGPNHDISQGRQQQVLDAGLVSNSRRQSQSRSSSNAPRRGSLARSSTLGRMSRLRSRFPGQSRSLASSRGTSSIFPPNMDVEMRMHILGALEEFNDIGMSSGLLHANRDFNENDYEMLLALDDGINRGGASSRQINGLPLSTVQSDYDEACAVCLDTPTAGDTIRHLPCLHKFHKDCIDPWLKRKTSCPVCKSSIT